MSNHRITILSLLSAIVLCAAPTLMAQTSSRSTAQDQIPATSAGGSSSTDARSTQPSASDATTGADSSKSPTSTGAPHAPSIEAPSSPETAQTTSRSTAASISSSAAAGTPTATNASDHQEIKRATESDKNMTVARLKGQRVRDASGHELGKVSDFIIEGGSGKIAHVVISTGGVLGVGDKLRLLPATNLKLSGAKEFTADMAQTDFEALPTVMEKDLKADRITAVVGKPRSSAAEPAGNSASTAGSHWVRASQLKDKSIRSDDRDVGELESIVIDLQSGRAMALIDAKGAFAREAGNYLVPFSKLEVRSQEADYIVSSLMRSDFGTGSSTSAPVTGASRSPSPSATAATTGPAPVSPMADGKSGRSESTQAVATSSNRNQDTSSQSAATTSSTPVAGTTDFSRSSASVRRSADSSAGIASTTSPSSSDKTSTAPASPSSPSPLPKPDRNSSVATSSNVRSSSSDTSTPASSPRRATDSPVSSDPAAPSTAAFASVAASTSPSSSSDAAITGDISRSPRSADTANSSSSVANTTPSPVSGDEHLTPTGRTSAEQSPATGATAMAIRHALDQDEMLARENLQVSTKIVLRGSVKSEEAKQKVEELAKRAANNAEIDNQIAVQPK